LNWRRLAPLRHAIVHALQSETAARTLAPADVRVRHRPGEASAAWLLVGWLRCRLKWTGADAVPAVEEVRHGDDLVGIGLRGPDWLVTATMSRQRITVESGAGRPPFTMPVPREAAADAIVAELRTLGHDTCLSDAVLSLADVSM
jgi:glucose-6-phosphate dehydrogenase assembly protein OpcA